MTQLNDIPGFAQLPEKVKRIFNEVDAQYADVRRQFNRSMVQLAINSQVSNESDLAELLGALVQNDQTTWNSYWEVFEHAAGRTAVLADVFLAQEVVGALLSKLQS